MPRKQGHPRDGVYVRKDRPGFWGSWIDGSGRRKQRKLQASTLEQAKILLSAEKLKADLQRTTGKTPPTEDTFNAWAPEFLKYQKRRISPAVVKGKITQAEYHRQEGIVKKHLQPFFGLMRLALIRKEDVNNYIETRLGVVSDGTIIKEMNTLKRLFSVAVSKEKIPGNPAHGADVPRAPEGRVRYLTSEELGRILRSCPEWLRPIAGLAVCLGTRRGELMNVPWEDVDIARREIRLRRTKNGKERPAFLNDLAMQVLTSMGAGTSKKKGLLFPDVTPENVTVTFIRACRMRVCLISRCTISVTTMRLRFG
jgi:integrase